MGLVGMVFIISILVDLIFIGWLFKLVIDVNNDCLYVKVFGKLVN